ncbi:YHYH domain-containing protein [Neobacillus sp. LXY-4]|uniref:YHYH domain-containing protein n=1 Tax=Neobacillus sp. LXY-4 TaxID=3379826 RepID=UPI003EE02A1E
MKRVLFLTCIFIATLGLSVQAHPGRTDSNGGHTCRTNCGDWGLSSGEYHYHNGGGSTSTSTSTESTATSTTSYDKDCTDFSSYDEVVTYWNSKGYTRYNDPERLDGWGNAVDDGIPCEAPGGYDAAKINGSDAQIAQQTAIKERAQGENDGYTAGVQAGYEGQSNEANPTGATAYNEGYITGFNKGYAEGSNKLNSEKDAAEQTGYEQGKQQDELAIPANLTNAHVTASFEKGFKKGVQERDQVEKEKYKQLGYEDGKKDIKNDPEGIKEIYIKAYNQGYKKGQRELQSFYQKKGYEAAFKMLKYQSPKLEKEKYEAWYKQGFESNEKVKKIAEAGFELGREGDEYRVPSNYKTAELIFKHNYELGYKEYEQEKEENTKEASAGAGILGLIWLGRRFYVARKMIS